MIFSMSKGGGFFIYTYMSSFSYNHDSQLARFLFYDSNPFMIQHNTRLTIYTLVKIPDVMLLDGSMELVDVNGYVQQISADDHKNVMGLAWGLFFAAILLNLLYYKLHPAIPPMTVTNDDKLRTHVCGTVWNLKKCRCGGKLSN